MTPTVAASMARLAVEARGGTVVWFNVGPDSAQLGVALGAEQHVEPVTIHRTGGLVDQVGSPLRAEESAWWVECGLYSLARPNDRWPADNADDVCAAVGELLDQLVSA